MLSMQSPAVDLYLKYCVTDIYRLFTTLHPEYSVCYTMFLSVCLSVCLFASVSICLVAVASLQYGYETVAV